MTVRIPAAGAEDEDGAENMGMDGVLESRNREQTGVKMRNHWLTAVFAVLIWLVMTIMNIANLVLLGLGKGG